MKYKYFDLAKIDSYKLIKDVVVHPLKVNEDKRGILVETIKRGWKDIYSEKYPFAQSYFSITYSNVARDEDQWHIHPTKQEDRFVVIKGKAVIALYDDRENSPTKGVLNLFKMGQFVNNKGYYTLLIPQKVYHCFLVVSKKEAVLLNFPTRLYDPEEEDRVKFKKAKLADESIFDWNKVRKKFALSLK